MTVTDDRTTMLLDENREKALDKPDIFIAYASEDREKAMAIREYLVKSSRGNLAVFIDKDTPGGETWSDFLTSQIRKSKIMLMLWSNVFSEKNYPKDEVILALRQGKYFGVLLESVSEEKMYGTINKTSVNLSGWNVGDDDKLKRLFSDLIRKIAIIDAASELEGEDPKDKMDEIFSCLINRDDQLIEVDEPLLENKYEIFLSKNTSSNNTKSFINHIVLKQHELRYEVLSKSEVKIRGLCSENVLDLRLSSLDACAFQLDLEAVLKGNGESELARWIEGGRYPIKVIYVLCDGNKLYRGRQEILSGAKKFLDGIDFSAFKDDRKLVVVFKFDSNKSAGSEAGLVAKLMGLFKEIEWCELSKFGELKMAHIDAFFSIDPLKSKYDQRKVESFLEGQASEEDKIIDYSLLRAALKQSRKVGGSL